MPSAAGSRVADSVIVEHDAWRDALADPMPLLQRAAGAALVQARRARRTRSSSPSVAVALIDDRAMRKLNRTYRGKDKPTNVLSFPAGESTEGKSKSRPIGDVAIALGTVKREAKAQGKTVGDHVTQRGVALALLMADTIALAKAFGANDDVGHRARSRRRSAAPCGGKTRCRQ